ncbi:PREDICTED: uncharacterized protein LOC109584806 [Amphimedon queenslandica]|uniref:Uncharacterized protein n=1 Tax=Amphimedon queenslandica TaxID=400682 RepID=A0AAN0JHG9_AMPQE|nr:PREDICTED: uncharacterized protein LOC109584806 [Amphimedon queenslandica]|eukprot:XP_019856241.1 PREDICTED: uncharacterized protein LOC109584806 [Amphimedon queenslandica]
MKTFYEKNIKQAITFIRQMGANVQNSIRYLFQNTFQKQLRDTLAELKTENGWLTSIEQDALEILKMLEMYYPIYVYETAKMIYNSSSDHWYHPPVTTLSAQGMYWTCTWRHLEDGLMDRIVLSSKSGDMSCYVARVFKED